MTTLGAARRAWTAPSDVLAGAIFVTVMGSLFLGIAIAATLFGPDSLVAMSAVFLALGGVLVALGLYNFLSRGPSAVVEYDRGFAALIRSKVSLWPWEELTSITSDVKYVQSKGGGYHSRVYTVLRRSGEKLVLRGSELENSPILIARIKERINQLHLPSLKSAYEAGEAMTFGPVTVSREGIRNGQHYAAWSTVGDANVKNGCLVVMMKDGAKALNVRVSKIPNVEQLGALIGIDPSQMDLTAV